MNQINKALLVPIIAFVALLLRHSTGIIIEQDAQDIAADAVLAAVTIWGFFVFPKRKPPEEPPEDEII